MAPSLCLDKRFLRERPLCIVLVEFAVIGAKGPLVHPVVAGPEGRGQVLLDFVAGRGLVRQHGLFIMVIYIYFISYF